MVAVTQIDKKRLRRGPEDDLTGAPVSTSPLVYSPGMDEGEMAFSTDTGRVFVGHVPQPGQRNYQRISHPYRNAEVLTELSPANREIFNENFSEITPEAHITAILPITGSNWTPVPVVDRFGNTRSYTFVGEYLALDMQYSIANAGVPIRIGRFSALNNGSASVANLVDRYIAMTGAMVEETYTSSTSNFQFRFNRFGTGISTYYAFEFQNRVGSPVALRFNSNRLI